MSPLTHRFSRSTWYLLGVIYGSMFALTLSSMLWSYRVHEESNRRWCGVLRIYHEAYQQNPAPATQLGRDIQAQLERLYADFHCDRVAKP